MTSPLVELSGVSKNYQGLRPLRIDKLTVESGDHVAILGFDAPMAEVFVNLVTAATLPDSGEVRIFGRTTASIETSAEWLSIVDRFGIVSERAVLLPALSALQNLALPFTLEIEPLADELQERAASLARDVGLPESSWPRPVAELDTPRQMRIRLGRALALDPAVLLLEHISAGIPREQVRQFGADIQAMAMRRGSTIIVATADPNFAAAVAARVLVLEPASGRLTDRPRAGWCRGQIRQILPLW